MTISEIRTILSQDDVAEELLQEILSDERKGVKTLVGSYMKRLERKSRERLRVESMYDVESRFYQEGLTHIVGIDEVGRGPLAGPVTVAAVILPPHWFCAGLNDSKKVTPKHRDVSGGEESDGLAGGGHCRCDAASFQLSDRVLDPWRCEECLCCGSFHRGKGVS